MPTTYTVIRRAMITEKGFGCEGNRGHAGVRSGREGDQDGGEAGGRNAVQGEGARVRTANMVGKERRRGKFSGYRPDWKKAYVRLKAGEKMPDYVNNL